jgi:D-lactate dehydrogenase
LKRLTAIVGRRHVLTGLERTRRYRTGFRFGAGRALAVVRPSTLVEQWRVLRACVAANTIVIMQAANTGLTGGSTPDGDGYDRDVVIISTLRMAKIYVIGAGRQVICLPGATLFQLERTLIPLKRAPHSVIGSSCIGASVFGGICNNSGGSLIRRGPAYTQLALYARVDESGGVHLVNHLGVRLGTDPMAILERLDQRSFGEDDVDYVTAGVASDRDYSQHVRDVAAATPARFNADPRRLFEASGSAGKIMLFAVRLDTFPLDENTAVFYIGSNDTTQLQAIRQHVLAKFESLPIAGEYLHRDAFDIAATYGKDMFLAIQYLGTARLPALFALKARLDSLADRCRIFPRDLSDKWMQAASKLFPNHLPQRMQAFRARFEHHLMLKMASAGVEEARSFLASLFPSQSGDFFECTAEEGAKAFLHRFAAAGAAIRYRAVHRHEVEDIVSLDIALRRNDADWFERLPPKVSAPITHALYYGHFFCHVFHQDYVVAKGQDTVALEHAMWELLDARGAQYPAEHNVGHLYRAGPHLAQHYRALDPCNAFNAGLGHTSKHAHWR